MPRPKNTVPGYKHHKPTNTARCWVGGRWVSLGKYDSPESRAEHARILAELAASPAAPAASRSRSDLSVAEVLLAFWRHAEQHYRRPDGSTTNQLVEYRYTLKPVRELYGHTPAHEFGPLALKAVRQRMVAAGWCRTTVNSRVGKVKHVFKWAVSEQLVPGDVYQALATVAGLQKGRTEAPEPDPVGPVADESVDAALPYLNRHCRA